MQLFFLLVLFLRTKGRNLFSHSSRGQKSEIRCWRAGSISGRLCFADSLWCFWSVPSPSHGPSLPPYLPSSGGLQSCWTMAHPHDLTLSVKTLSPSKFIFWCFGHWDFNIGIWGGYRWNHNSAQARNLRLGFQGPLPCLLTPVSSQDLLLLSMSTASLHLHIWWPLPSDSSPPASSPLQTLSAILNHLVPGLKTFFWFLRDRLTL